MISALEILYQFDIFRAPAVNTVATTAAVATSTTTTTTSSSAATVATMMMMLMMMLMVMLMMFVMVLMMDCLRRIVCVGHMVCLYDHHRQKHHQQTEGKGELHLGSLVFKERCVSEKKEDCLMKHCQFSKVFL